MASSDLMEARTEQKTDLHIAGGNSAADGLQTRMAASAPLGLQLPNLDGFELLASIIMWSN